MALLAFSREFVFLFCYFCLPCLVPFVSRPRIETSQSKYILSDHILQCVITHQGPVDRPWDVMGRWFSRLILGSPSSLGTVLGFKTALKQVRSYIGQSPRCCMRLCIKLDGQRKWTDHPRPDHVGGVEWVII